MADPRTTAAPAEPQAEADSGDRHKLYEDVLALLLGTILVALGMAFYTKAQLLVGSTAGLALLLHYITSIEFWIVFSVINLPFYVLGVIRMGWMFTLRTFAAVTLVSVFTRLTRNWVEISHLDPVYAAVMGGCLAGVGLLILFRHRTGLGGINIVALYLQEKFNIRAGIFQLVVDGCILFASFFVLEPENIALSVFSAFILNMILAMNHKPGRYRGIT